jgi:quercetin dioxygenase-like cupin family protein
VPTAAEYALRILYTVTPAGGVGGAAFAVHSHPGTESWYVAAGEQMVWTPGLAVRTEAGQNYAGRPGGTPMILVNTGGEDRRAFTLLVVDAAQPSLSPAIFP